MMLRNYRELYKTTDEMGRTPLSYASYVGFLEGVKYMINTDEFQNQAYKIDEHGFFPVHWACCGGNMDVVKEFFCSYPKYTRWLLNRKGQNILHVAAGSGKAKVVQFILERQELETMINMKDEDGNTPFLLGSKGKHPKRLTWLSLRYAGVPRATQVHYINITDLNEADIDTKNPHTLQQNNCISPNPTTLVVVDQQRNTIKQHPKMKGKIKYKERINTLLVVSILVATVTFASGFTVPGGYKNENPNEGMATLAHKCAFQVFVITNTIALYSSILAAVTLIWAHLDDLRLILLSLDFALPLLGTALSMMSVAFTAGLYVVLDNVVLWLGIVVLAMGGVFLGALFVFFIPLYSPTSCIRNNILRYVFHVPFTLMLLACEKGENEMHFG
ncbi:Protein ACCELERATED CELL DEATH 6 [Bienertia sinuspersici]